MSKKPLANVIYLTTDNLRFAGPNDYLIVETFDDRLVERLASNYHGWYRFSRPGRISQGFNVALNHLKDEYTYVQIAREPKLIKMIGNAHYSKNNIFESMYIHTDLIDMLGYLDGGMYNDFFDIDYVIRTRVRGLLPFYQRNEVDETLTSQPNGLDLLKFAAKWGITENVDYKEFLTYVEGKNHSWKEEMKVELPNIKEWKYF